MVGKRDGGDSDVNSDGAGTVGKITPRTGAASGRAIYIVRTRKSLCFYRIKVLYSHFITSCPACLSYGIVSEAASAASDRSGDTQSKNRGSSARRQLTTRDWLCKITLKLSCIFGRNDDRQMTISSGR